MKSGLCARAGRSPGISWRGSLERELDQFLRALVREERASPRDDGLFLPHKTIAELPHALALSIGLPDLARVALTLRFEGRINSPEGRLRLDWMGVDHRPVTPRRQGAFLTVGDRAGRLTQTLFELCTGADGFNGTVGKDIETRIAAWAPVQTALVTGVGREVKADAYATSLFFYQSGAFALDIVEGSEGPDFTPILMSPVTPAGTDDQAPSEEVAEDGDIEPPAPGLQATAPTPCFPRICNAILLINFRQAAPGRTTPMLLAGMHMSSSLPILRSHWTSCARSDALGSKNAALSCAIRELR